MFPGVVAAELEISRAALQRLLEDPAARPARKPSPRRVVCTETQLRELFDDVTARLAGGGDPAEVLRGVLGVLAEAAGGASLSDAIQQALAGPADVAA